VLFPALEEAWNSESLRFGERALTCGELRGVVGHVARQLEGVARVAVWALPALETCSSVLGALAAGVPVVPINPKSGQRELEHMVSDGGPEVVMCGPEAKLPEALVELRRVDVDLGARDVRPASRSLSATA
jgi:malonyl-CoA/methylmalonyl-CoA synthetase